MKCDDKPQEAAGTQDVCIHVGDSSPVPPTSPVPALCRRPVARSGPSSDPRMASKDLAMLHRVAGDGLCPQGVLLVTAPSLQAASLGCELGHPPQLGLKPSCVGTASNEPVLPSLQLGAAVAMQMAKML